MKFSKTFILTLTLVLLDIVVIAQTTPINTKIPCSVTTLQGTYGVLEQGTVVLPISIPGTPPPPFPAINSAIATYNGAGKFWGKWTGSFGGAVVSGIFSGTYEVKPECTYSDEFSPLPGVVAHHLGSIVGHGMAQQIQFMYTDPFLFATGTAKRTPPEGCSQKTLEGTYAVLGQGTDVSIPLPGLTPPFPMGHVAKLSFDGAGHVAGEGTEDTNGFTFPATYRGTYTVDENCRVSFVIDDTALGTTMTIPLEGTITGKGPFRQIHSIVTGPGEVFSDAWKKQ